MFNDETSAWLDAPLIISDNKLREIILQVLNQWAREETEDMEDFLNKRMKAVKEQASLTKGRTQGKERILGAVPGYVAMELRTILGLDWWRTNTRALGILFEIFEEGRTFYKEGEGYSRIQLNDADMKVRIS